MGGEEASDVTRVALLLGEPSSFAIVAIEYGRETQRKEKEKVERNERGSILSQRWPPLLLPLLLSSPLPPIAVQ